MKDMKKRIMMIFGTRPEAIKMCPLACTLREREGHEVSILLTGQHRELLYGVMDAFGVRPDYDLSLMREGQDLFDLTERILSGVREILVSDRPDLVLVHGDTVTAFASALAAYYLRIPVGHVEAGLRTYDLSAPFPEEWNRRAISLLAAYHFAPTEGARQNLLREGVRADRVFLTGNTGIDALSYTVREDFSSPYSDFSAGGRLILLTAHRRENQGEPLRAILRGIRRVVEEWEEVRVLYAVHPSPSVRAVAREELSGCERILLAEPLDPICFHNLLARCCFCVTDSGGIQEEAASLGRPVLILRDCTERPEGVSEGAARLIGRSEETVARGVANLLEHPALYAAMAQRRALYGNGSASEQIAEILEREETAFAARNG